MTRSPAAFRKFAKRGHRVKKKAAPSGAASFVDLEMVLS
jgi:hypothetical protein